MHQSWHEPRRFFFWLSLVSLFVLALTVLATGPVGNVPAFFPWIALAAILGFVLGIPAFVLAWIPPLRPFFARLLRHKLLVAAGLVTLLALFYAVENWRGRSAWNDFRREQEALGIRFDLESLGPPPVPAAENMFEAGPWTDLHFTKTPSGVVYQNTNIQNEVWFDCSGPNDPPKSTDVFTARRINLVAWQQFYRGTNNVFPAGHSGTNYFPITATPQTPAQDVLLALSRFEPRLAQIRAAAQRPHARFWINFEDGAGALLPHLAKMKGIVQYMRLRAVALLAEGRTDAALTDLQLAMHINDAVRDEPTLISQLVRIAIAHLNLSVIWEGLAVHRWSETQLATLERDLAPVDFLAGYHTGMKGERYLGIWAMDYLRRTGDLDIFSEPADAANYGDFAGQMEQAAGRLLFGLAPTGWFEQNKFSLSQKHATLIRPLVDQEKQMVSPAASRRTATALQTMRRTPYDLFSAALIPAISQSAQKFATAQTYVNLARIAIALERHRLASGGYPENLAALTPKFLAQLPHDIINGQPLQYRRTDDDSFILYSIGWNETDDGGTVVMNKSGQFAEQTRGDWVWRYPQP